MSQTILLKVHNATKTVAEHTVVTKDGQPTVIKAQSRVNYELLNPARGTAPDHIITKRVGQDLHISLEKEGKESDIIIEDYYDNPNSAIIGIAEDGQYYYYIPDTGEVVDYVTELALGDIEGQALGGHPYAAPWWMGATTEGGILPWLVGLAVAGGIAALVGRDKDDGDDNNQTPTPTVNVTHKDTDGDGVDDKSVVTGKTTPNTPVAIDTNGDGTPDVTVTSDNDGNYTTENLPVIPAGTKVGATATQPGKDPSDKAEATSPAVDTTPNTQPVEQTPTPTVNVTHKDTDGDGVDDKSVVTGKTTPNTPVAIDTNGDGTPDVTVTSDNDGNYTTENLPVIPAGTKVGATATQPGKDPSDKAEATSPAVDTTPTPVDATDTPDIDEQPVGQDGDGPITTKPGNDNTKATTTYTDEDGNPQTIVATKDPVTGKWTATDTNGNPVSTTPTTDDKTPFIDPTTGTVTLPKDAVDNEKPVKVTGEKDGAAPATTEIDRIDRPTISRHPADQDGDAAIDVTPGKDNTKATVYYTDEDGNPQTITLTKQPDGTWTATDKDDNPVSTTPTTDDKTPFIDPTTGTVTLPKDSVDNSKPVTVTAERDGTTPVTDKTDPAQVGTVTNPTAVNEGENLVTTVTLNGTAGNPSLPFSRGGNATDADFDDVTFSNGVTKNADGTLNVPAGVTSFTITTPVKADGTTEATPETVNYTVGGVNGPEATIADTSTTPAAQPTPPVAPTTAPNLTDASDTGASNSDDKTADNTPSFTIPAPKEGETPVLFVNGVEVPSTFDPVTNTITPNSPLADGPQTITTATRKGTETSEQGPALPITVDTTPPSIQTAEVPANGDELVLTYNEPLDPANPPALDKFTVTVDGQPVTPTAVTVSGDKVTLTLPEDAVKQGQPVTVTYNDPTTGNDPAATQDVAGNDAPTETPAVTNNSTVTVPPVATPPVAPTTAPNLTDASDTGASNSDDKTADNTPSFTIPAPKEGETPVLFVNGVEVPSTFDPVTNTITPNSPLADGPQTITTATRKGTETSEQGPALPITVDTTPPSIQTAEVPANGDELVLTYNEPLDPANPPALDKFTVTVDGQPVTPTAVTVSGDKVTLTLPEDAVKQGQPVTVTYNDPTTGNDPAATQDVAGNDAPTETPAVTNNSTVTVPPVATPPVAPTTAPNLTDASDTGASNSDDKTADNTPSFTIPAPKEGETPVLFVNGVEVPSTFDPVTNTITPNSPLADGPQTITTATRKGTETSEQGPALPITVDTTPPSIQTAEVPANGDELVLTYNEPLDPANPPALDKFTVTVDGQPVTPTAVTVSGDKVTLTLPEDAVKQGQPVTVTYNDPTTGNDPAATQDVAGNDAPTETPAVTNNSTVTVPPVATPPVAPTTAPNLTDASDTGASNSDDKTADNTPSFTIPAPKEGETPVLFVNGVEVPSTFDPVTNTITPNSPLADGPQTITTATRKGTETSEQGPALPITVDTTPPSIQTAEVPANGDELVLTYNEPLDPANPPALDKFTVTVDGQPVTPTAVTVSGDKVTLTLPEDAVKQGQPVTVTYNDPTTGNDPAATQDVAGNDAPTETPAVTNNSTVTVPPVATPPVAPTTAPNLTDASDTGASNSDDKTADNTPSFTIPAPKEGETPVLFVNGVEVPSTFDPVTNTITPNSPLADGPQTITTATRKGTETSEQGPALPITVDTTPPSIQTAEVPANGDELVLTYNEPLDPANPPALDKFTVTVDGQPVTPTAVTVSGDKVTLTLPEDAVKQGQPVTVTYNDPTTGNDPAATQDVAGNDAPTETPAVTNNSTVTVPPVATPPVAPTTAPNLTDASDTGASNSDDKTADNTPSFTIPAPKEGETPVLFVNGVEVPSTFDPVTNTITPNSPLADGPQTITTATRKGTETSEQGPALPITVDTTPPSIQTAEVPANGDELVLTYNEPLDPANPPALDKFTVTVDGQPVTPTAVTVSGDKVTLTLPEDAVKQGQPVTVTYNDPTTGNDPAATQDVAGNDAPTETPAVTNNSTVEDAPALQPPVAGKTVTDVNMVVPTNDVRFGDIKLSFGQVADSSGTITRADDGSSITWGIRQRPAGLSFKNPGQSDGADLDSINAATLVHTNVATPSTTNMRQTNLNLQANISLNGKTSTFTVKDVGTIYMLETPSTVAGDDDFFVFVPTTHSITIDGKQYNLSMISTDPAANAQNRTAVEAAIQNRNMSASLVPAGLRNLSEADKAKAVYERSAESGGANDVALAFKLDPVSPDAIKPVEVPAPYTGKVADTVEAWTAGAGTGVTITSKGGNTFAVNKNGVEIGEFAGQANGDYTFTPKAGIKGIDGNETLVATFNKGDHAVNLNLTGKFSNTVVAGEDLVDSIYAVKADSAKDIDFKLIGDVEMIDLSLITGANLQNVTKDQVTASQNNELYIRGGSDDTVVLGDVLQAAATVQTDGAGSWTKGAAKNGSTVDGDTKVYDTWTNDGTTLYIEQGITVI